MVRRGTGRGPKVISPAETTEIIDLTEPESLEQARARAEAAEARAELLKAQLLKVDDLAEAFINAVRLLVDDAFPDKPADS